MMTCQRSGWAPSARPAKRLAAARLVAPMAALALVGAPPEPPRAAQEAPGQNDEAQTEAQTAARATLERVAKGLEDVRELRAEYTQEQDSLLLDEPLVSSGRLHLRADPGCIVLELDEPRPVLIRSDAKTHLVYHPARKRAERFLFESNELARALLACFTADLARIEELFRITGYTEDLDEQRAVLRLHPIRDEVRSAVRSLTLELDLATGLPARIVQVNAEGEELRLHLRNAVRNPERAPGETPIFDLPLPPDVELIERRIPRTEGGTGDRL